MRGTRGWDGTPSSRVLPEDWIGHEITYWTPNRFDVTFDGNGGNVAPGHAFMGWWTRSAGGASVTVKDGGGAIAVDAVKVAAMFEATSSLDDWDATAKLPLSVEAVEAANVGNGYSMRFQVALPANAERAFLRIRH